MQPHLAKLLKTNESPSEGTLIEVKELLSKPLQELENKEAEIERLEQTLKNLQEERDVIQNSIKEYATILSPIRRLPSDIVHEIFYHCLPIHRNPIMSITEAPLLLTRICQPWRSIALASHRIWSRVHVALLPCSIGHSTPYHSPGMGANGAWQRERDSIEKYSRTMRARCKLADIWLSRSGSCPLSISLNFGGMDRMDDNLDDGNALVQLLITIISFSHRFSDIELSLPYEVYRVIETRITLEMIPRLQKLKINFFEPVTPHPEMAKRNVILLQAPKLQSISLYTDNISVFDSRNIPTAWENLTFLAFNSAITSADAVEVLRRCDNLVHCKLVISDGLDVYIGPEDILSLPRLQTLSIHVGGTDLMALLYRRIDAPTLNSFDYQKYNRFPFSNAGYGSASNPPSPILSLLEKYSTIKKLSFDSRILTAQDILFTFRFASQLTHLILGPRPRNGSHYGDFGHYLGPGNFTLDLLTVDEELDPSISEKEILLPNLEVFEAYVPVSTFSDEILQRFILGRLGDPARKGVASLKKVTINFDRPKFESLDISEEVYRRAKAAGVEIELDLRYITTEPRANSKYIDIFSPWYGLTEESDRSWTFADLEAGGF
ncbi:hypothetical protein GALMADRAFT_88974 [Galerina marginata CBS 339.88]|uniref:F-box domain-containing protein n=1 Tax=Galerina marginata (strain CBS 339.88) TaxID=685588 RepID=A0A067TVU1_GALM3|nr:hypothetical protein GALMADRAFT_88974 [Galerina marginata CBS 339.88]